jgi:hypothetical protein
LSAPRQAGLLLGALLWALGPACSVVVDPDELRAGCGAGHKPCEIEPGELGCVGTGEADYGCARESCVPCTLAHAVEVCGSDGDCAIGTCEPGYENCDLTAKNGCEVNLEASYDDCGGCGSSCDSALRDMPRARSAQCNSGRCAVDECEAGYADCDGAASNGCEKALPEAACGHCAGCPGSTQCNVETRRCE